MASPYRTAPVRPGTRHQTVRFLRQTLADGDIQLTALTTAASLWSAGVPARRSARSRLRRRCSDQHAGLDDGHADRRRLPRRPSEDLELGRRHHVRWLRRCRSHGHRVSCRLPHLYRPRCPHRHAHRHGPWWPGDGAKLPLFVSYDPNGPFATGGGSIVPGGSSSDGGDLLPGIDGTSKANFGFVVKYKNG